MSRRFSVLCGALAAFAASHTAAAEHTVQMLNRGPEGAMVFSPAFIQAQPGDTIRFVPHDPGHNAETVAGMLPMGAPAQRGAMGREFALRVSRPGLYGVKCSPHFSMGMVALIQVGRAPANRASVQATIARTPTLARRRFTDLFAHVR